MVLLTPFMIMAMVMSTKTRMSTLSTKMNQIAIREIPTTPTRRTLMTTREIPTPTRRTLMTTREIPMSTKANPRETTKENPRETTREAIKETPREITKSPMTIRETTKANMDTKEMSTRETMTVGTKENLRNPMITRILMTIRTTIATRGNLETRNRTTTPADTTNIKPTL